MEDDKTQPGFPGSTTDSIRPAQSAKGDGGDGEDDRITLVNGRANSSRDPSPIIRRPDGGAKLGTGKEQSTTVYNKDGRPVHDQALGLVRKRARSRLWRDLARLASICFVVIGALFLIAREVLRSGAMDELIAVIMFGALGLTVVLYLVHEVVAIYNHHFRKTT